MTEVTFHFNVPDRLAYACRLLRKATRQGARVAVTAGSETLSRLDKALWTFEPNDFVPHVRLPPGSTPAQRLLPTPIWLVEQLADAPQRNVALNLGLEMPQGFESFERMIEIVSLSDEDRQAGRERWKHYIGRGYTITRHEVNDER